MHWHLLVCVRRCVACWERKSGVAHSIRVLGHGHEVPGGDKVAGVRVLGLGLGDPSKVLFQLWTNWHWVIEESQKKCMLRRGRVALAQPGVGQGWWFWGKGAK